MAHFAQLDENNIVTGVLVVNNEKIVDENGNESEQKGIDFLKALFGQDTVWVQTSYNGNFRNKYAAIDYTYDAIRNAFICPKPFNSWVLNEETYSWEAPIPVPDNENKYVWNENELKWDLIDEPYRLAPTIQR